MTTLSTLLYIKNLCVAYDARQVLHNINLSLEVGNVIAVHGRNGSGRSTLLKAIAGHVPIQSGRLLWYASKDGKDNIDTKEQDFTYLPIYERAHLGISWLPESREVFIDLTTQENLLLGLGGKIKRDLQNKALAAIYDRYPLLARRAHIKAGALSGGEQQLLAFARAVILSDRKLLLLDEPTEGLASAVIQQMQQHLFELKAQGTAILLVEQKNQLSQALAAQDYYL